ncbi:MAG: hypothetical protein JRJ00_06935 [Deltaproteobacteria bacterium]|nr:hypothetical protein [Deltaproteobacteria bacterium]
MDRTMRRILLLTVSIILTFGTSLRAEDPKKTAVEKLLDILKEKEIITQTQYKELKGEFAEEENELEEQKQVVQKVKSWEEKIPNMGYKNGKAGKRRFPTWDTKMDSFWKRKIKNSN